MEDVSANDVLNAAVECYEKHGHPEKTKEDIEMKMRKHMKDAGIPITASAFMAFARGAGFITAYIINSKPDDVNNIKILLAGLYAIAKQKRDDVEKISADAVLKTGHIEAMRKIGKKSKIYDTETKRKSEKN